MTELDVPLWSWLLLGGVVAVSLTVDLFAHRTTRGRGRRAAVVWSVVWIGLALAFGAWVWLDLGRKAGGEYFAAWLLEKSLSVDNLFVFLVVFERLEIDENDQHRVLFWGILGALVTRGLFIAGGTAMLAAWSGTLYVMGAFLVLTGLRTATEKPEAKSKLLEVVRRRLPVSREHHGHRFVAREAGRLVVTPLLLALVVIELTDVVFAVDSIPAVLAVSDEPFIVYSSNVFAVLGLRALYLVLAGAVFKLRYLRLGLGAILVLVGAKMLASRFVHVPPSVSLGAIASIMVVTVAASLLMERRAARGSHPTPAEGQP